MSSLDYSKIISMDKAARKFFKVTLQIANSVMAITGIAILMYTFWMIVVSLGDYSKYHFSCRFLWASLGTGIIFNYIASLGQAAVHSKGKFLMTLYIVLLFLVMLLEALITADICRNEEWDRDFPKDHTDLFDDFVDFVKYHWDLFKWLCMMIAFCQIISFSLAMVLRIMGKKLKYEDEVVSAKLPFLHHEIQQTPPYVVVHPDLLPYYYPALTAAPYVYPHGDADVEDNKKGEYAAKPKPGC